MDAMSSGQKSIASINGSFGRFTVPGVAGTQLPTWGEGQGFSWQLPINNPCGEHPVGHGRRAHRNAFSKASFSKHPTLWLTYATSGESPKSFLPPSPVHISTSSSPLKFNLRKSSLLQLYLPQKSCQIEWPYHFFTAFLKSLNLISWVEFEDLPEKGESRRPALVCPFPTLLWKISVIL